MSFAFLIACSALVQDPYRGPEIFKVGDNVEATYLGKWEKATVVGVDTEGKRYKIHFEGEKYCNGHALDTFIANKWVRPRGGAKTKPLPKNPMPKAPAGIYKVGDRVLKRGGGPLWSPGAMIEKYDAAKRQYHLRYDHGGGDIVPVHSVYRPGDKIDNSFFLGKWIVHISGSTHVGKEGGQSKQYFSGGMKLPPLEIKADGTYVWRDLKKTIKGRWKARGDVPGIVILKGMDGRDWTVYESTEGYAPTDKTRDEIRFHHVPSGAGYYMAYRIGPNRSSVLKGRKF